MTRGLLSLAIASSLLLVGCGDDNERFVESPSSSTSAKFVKTFTANDINSGLGLGSSAAPTAKCGVTIEKVSYNTKGAADEDTNATAALMLPTGDAAECKGDRPVLLYAHGTTTDKGYDFAQVGNAKNPAVGEANLIAANFAAQGYIVIAPNYAGYDDSKLDYHPYLVAQQQSTDMVDALDSARSIIERKKRANDANYSKIDDSGKLFIAGYSQGGYVTMATARLLESQKKAVTAIAPSSGPYALAAFGDAIFAGNVNIGATRFAPLLASGLQRKYPNIYNNPSEIFTDNYVNTKLPSSLSFGELVDANKLPDNALFEKDPENNPTLDLLPSTTVPFAFIGFADENYLIRTDFRTAYVADLLKNPDNLIAKTGLLPAANPQNSLRKALKDNDLRSYIPQMPTLLCGGNQDPTVFYDLNTGSMAAIMQANVAKNPTLNVNVTVLDVDVTTAASRPNIPNVQIIGQASSNQWNINSVVESVQNNFVQNIQRVVDAGAQQGIPANIAVLGNYHGGLVSTACTQATREFFNQEFKSV